MHEIRYMRYRTEFLIDLMPGLWYLRGVYGASDSGVGGGRVVVC